MSVPGEGEMRTMLGTLPRLRPALVHRAPRVTLVTPRLAPEQQLVVGLGAAFANVMQQWTPYLRRKAWSLSHHDPDLAGSEPAGKVLPRRPRTAQLKGDLRQPHPDDRRHRQPGRREPSEQRIGQRSS